MAYVYGKLKEAILGSQGDKMSKDLSPNMIKAIYIGKDNIMVVYHTKSVRTTKMDFEKVSQELGSGNARNESLNNVLNKYKMGCVEEIYADSAYRNIQGGYLDLQRYVDGLNRCRLRYYGWFSGDAQLVAQYYENARVQHNYLYCVANDSNVRGKVINIEAYQVQGKAEPWYKVHDLRPNDYSADRLLGGYFNSVDAEIERIASEQEQAVLSKGVEAITKAIVEREVSRLADYSIYFAMYKMSKAHFGEMGTKVWNHMFSIGGKSGVKRATDVGAGGEMLLKAENFAKVMATDEVNGTQMLKSIELQDLKDRYESGNDLWGARCQYFDRMKSMCRVSNDSKLRVCLYQAMIDAGVKCSFNPEDMERALVEVSKSGDWFRKFNLIVGGMLGFDSYEGINSYMKAVTVRGGN